MIDLHLHTTASDGLLTPSELVNRAMRSGIRTLSITDHDTMAGVPIAAEAASKLGLEFLPGVEITASLESRDIHILGYFIDQNPPELEPFLKAQQVDRCLRAREIAARLAKLGAYIDIDALIKEAEAESRAVARPLIAAALVKSGHASSKQEAFNKWLGDGCSAYVPRRGASPADVVRLISKAGGISALAHPGLLRRDELIPDLVKAGLVAIEVYHSQHNNARQSNYAKIARQYGLAMCGGSDYHGDDHHSAKFFGSIGLPREEFILLFQRLLAAHNSVNN